MGNRSSLTATTTAAQNAGRTQTTGRSARLYRHSVHSASRVAVGAAAPGNGMRLRNDLLAPRTRLARGRCLGQAASRSAGQAAPRQPHRFLARDCRQFVGAGRAWGKKTGPSPTDRRKAGSKHHLLVDAAGTPLNVILTGANRHDSTQLMPLLDGF